MTQPKISEKAQEAIFKQIQQNPVNNECADCHTKAPNWISLDFGVFVCIRCSGVHRQLGPHITRVRSTKLDGWTKDNIEIMSTVGNHVANSYYEQNMPNGFRKPNVNTSSDDCRRFIDQKYIKKAWAVPGYEVPVKAFVDARSKGVKPDFSYFQGATKQEEAQEQQQERVPNQREGTQRKKSVSLDKLPPDTQPSQQYHDLLNGDDDLLGGGAQPNNNQFQPHHNHTVSDPTGQNNHTPSPQPKKINFANFKKAQSQGTSTTETQPQTNNQGQNQNQPNGPFGMNNNANQNTNNSPFNNNNQNNNSNSPFNNNNNNNQQQSPQNNVDVMNLYKQQTHPMAHQNHFMQGGSHQHSWSANAGGWGHNNNNNNQNMYGGGFNNGYNMGNNNFNGNMNPPMNYGMQPTMGYNNFNNMQPSGNFGMNNGGNFGNANVNSAQFNITNLYPK